MVIIAPKPQNCAYKILTVRKFSLIYAKKNIHLEKKPMQAISKLIITCSALAIVAGCAVRTPGASVVIDPDRRSSVTIGDGHDHGDGKFCPPGQAKKGRC